MSEEVVNLRCVDCGSEFEFSARDAAFYKEKGWNTPRRCKGCRDKRKPALGLPPGIAPGNHASDSEVIASKTVQKYKVNCSSCGVQTMVPFKPNAGQPAYCRSCFNRIRAKK